MIRKMKDSGIEWLGKIPESWGLFKAKYYFSERTSRGNDKSLTLLSPTQKFGVIPQALYEELTGASAVKLKEETNLNYLKTVHADDFCISLRSFQGGFEHSRYEGVVSPAYHVFYGNSKINPLYWKMLFKTNAFIEKVGTFSDSLRDGKNISFSDFGNMTLPLPSFDTQANIAWYLNSQCSRIDQLSENLTRQIEVLKEYKKALITQAVTKGLDPDVEMKESGIEWIALIPKTWSVRRFKHFFTSITDGSHFSPEVQEEGKPYVTATNISGIGIDLNKTKKISEKDFELLSHQNCKLNKGDILLVKDGATTGRVGYFNKEDEAVFLSSVASLKTGINSDSLFAYYAIQSQVVQNQIEVSMAGAAMPRITLTKIAEYQLPVPPVGEQKQIAEFLNRKCRVIDSNIDTLTEQLSIVTEYKKSLIYDYVTGKKEVPASFLKENRNE